MVNRAQVDKENPLSISLPFHSEVSKHMNGQENNKIEEIPKIETERLTLRKMCIDDAKDMFVYTSDLEVAHYWIHHRSIQDTMNYLRILEDDYKEKQAFNRGIVYKKNGKFIGTCGFVAWNQDNRWAEIGYALSKKYWSKGIITEAVKAIIKFGFEQNRSTV